MKKNELTSTRAFPIENKSVLVSSNSFLKLKSINNRFHENHEKFLLAFQDTIKRTEGKSLNESRHIFTDLFTQGAKHEPVADIQDQFVEDSNKVKIPIRIFTPIKTKEQLPIFVFFHGGGWVFGNIEEADSACRRIANHLNHIVISVEYRLAPENKFPAALEDCCAVTKWAFNYASTFGGNKDSITVGGESAGGNLAAAVSMKFRDDKLDIIKNQILFYPVITYGLNNQIYAQCHDQVFLTKQAMQMFWDSYVGPAPTNVPCYASVSSAASFANLPRACIITAGHDPLKQEGEHYAMLLRNAGVSVEHLNYPDSIHGFMSLPIAEPPYARETLEHIKLFLNDYTKNLSIQRNSIN